MKPTDKLIEEIKELIKKWEDEEKTGHGAFMAHNSDFTCIEIDGSVDLMGWCLEVAEAARADRDKEILEMLDGSISIIKPYHGNCCCCQDCGHAHDECMCFYNQSIPKVKALISSNNNEAQ